MEKEEKFFLVTQRDSLAYAAAGTRKSEKFEVHFTKLGAKKTLTRKANTSPSDDGTLVEANQFYQYCVVDEQDRLVKPKKITKKGKNLRVDINDTYQFELLNFFERDKNKDGVTKFVSHRNGETSNYEAINSVDAQLVELAPDHQDVAWCSRAGFIAAAEPAGHNVYAAEDLRYGQIYTLLPVLPAPEIMAPVVGAADEVAVAALPSLLPSFSPWVSGGAAAIALLSRGGGAGAAAAPVPPVISDLVVHGNIMLGPLIAGTDLQVTAYDAAGNKLPSSTGNPITVTPNAISGGFDYAITITGGYRGVVTVRLSNPGGNLDYVSEFTAAQVNLGTGALLAADNVAAAATEWIINITQATDLAARRILSAASADTDAPQLAAGVQATDVTDANIAVTNALLPSLAGTRTPITQLLPKSTIGTNGQSSGDTSDYALLLHTLDVVAQQAAASPTPLTLQQVQTNISKLLIWPNADYKTATLQTQLPLLDTTKTDAANNVWVASSTAAFGQNENLGNSYLAAVKPADIPTNPATGQPYKVTYEITGGTDKSLFDINPTTGQLTWKAAPDYEAPKDQGADNTYQIIVTAITDAPLTSAYLSSSQVVTIKVNNVAETTVTPPVVVPTTPTTPVTPAVPELVVHGNIMLGPLIAGTDLQVTAYDAAGNKLLSTGNPITVTPNAIMGGFDYAITVTGGYRGVVTVRLSNPGGNLDYVSEFTATKVNLGTGALLGSDNVAAAATEWIINITQATDLAARRILSAASADTDAPQLAAGVQASDVTDANIAVTNALLPSSAGTRITQLLPKSTIGTDGQASGDTSDYALLLHTLDVVAQQAAASPTPLTLQQVQTNISKLLIWPNADYKTATLQTQLPLLDTTKTDASNGVWVASSTANFEQNENLRNSYLAAVKPADIPTNPATGAPYNVTYKITGGADQSLFNINATTGQLTWKIAPDFEGPTHPQNTADLTNVYKVIVTAVTDAPLTSAYLSSSQVVTITVNNIPDAPPVFKSGTTVEVPLGQVDAYTSDVKFDSSTDNHTYALGGTNATSFTIDTTTGLVKFVGTPPIAWTADNVYNITVTATDTTVRDALIAAGDPSPALADYEATQNVAITVLPLLAKTTLTTFATLNQSSGKDALDVASNLEIKFTTAVAIPAGAGKKLHLVDKDGPNPTIHIDLNSTEASLSADGKTLTINPTNDLDKSNNYQILIDAGAFDIVSNTSPTTEFSGAALDFWTKPPFTLTLATGITDLEVISPIVLSAPDKIATALHKKITFTNLANDAAKNGFASEGADNSFEIYADDTRYVTITDNYVSIKPPFDFDFANHYQIKVEDGAFKTAGDSANGVPVRTTQATIDDPTAVGALLFSTVNVAANQAAVDDPNTALAQTMLADGKVTTTGTKKWFAVDGTVGATTTADLSTYDYAMVFKDQNSAGQNPNVNDGVFASKFDVTATNFGTGDLVYADDQNNKKDYLNNSVSTQIIDYGVAGQLTLHFDPNTANSGVLADTGGTFTLKAPDKADGTAGALTFQNVIDRINIANTSVVPTPITAIQRVDSLGADVASNLLGTNITDAQPLRIKVSAAFKAGDTLQLVYVGSDGVIHNWGASTLHTINATDVGNKYATLSLTPTQLDDLPEHEGFNKIFAKLNVKVVNDAVTSWAVNYSDLLGGDSGVYLDTVAPAPTLTFATGSSATLTALDTTVGLVVQASHLKVGDKLALASGGAAIGSPSIYEVKADNLGSDAVFQVARADLASGDNTLEVTSTDAAGNEGKSSVVIHNEFVVYSGATGLGPVLADNDLQVTAYDKNGAVLDKSNIDSLGTFSLKINKTYTGAITLRVGNNAATVTPGKADYRDEGQDTNGTPGKNIDIGTGTIAAVVVADGSAKSVNVSTLTDLVARQLSSGSNIVSDADALKITQYNLKLATLLGVPDPDSKGIIGIAPTFVMSNTGAATLNAGAAGKYGQLLAQISDQAVAKGATLDAIQTQLSNAIAWGWDGSAATATAAGDIAKQVLLLAQVAQAAALADGSDASDILKVADITSYLDPSGTGPISVLSDARKANLIDRIVKSVSAGDDDGRLFDTLTELQALADKVVALAKIQDYADLDTNPAPTVADYTAAKLTGITVTADNLAAVNLRVLASTAEGTKTDALIGTVVANGIQDQTDAVAKIVAYADNNTQPRPTLTDYIKAGVTGANADNLAAINAQVDAKAGTDVNSLSLAQGVADTSITAYNTAVAAIRAYIRDSVANPAPAVSTFANVGLPTLDAADEIASAKYYLATVMLAADAELPGADILSKLTAQQTALKKINAFAADSGNPLGTPDATDYAAAGITGADASNLSILNGLINGKSFNAAALATLLNDVFATPALLSIELAGTSVVNGAFQTDAYLNAAELAAGQEARFKVSFNRGVKGLTAANFDLTDDHGQAIAGATLSISSADNDVGQVWRVTATGLTGLTNASTLRLNLANNTDVVDTSASLHPEPLVTTSFTSGKVYTVDTANTIAIDAVTGQDRTLSLSESSVDLYVSPTHLAVGDTLKLFKVAANGTLVQLGSEGPLTAAHLSTGVTFTVEKTNVDLTLSLANGDNTLRVQSTDAAGNIATADIHVTVSEYAQLSGTLGLPSQVLAAQDLTVTAYNENGTVVGTGTVKANTNTYNLQLLKVAGPVKLKLTSSSTGKDFRDEATNADTDLGNMAISATFNATNADTQIAHITLLTDLASRIITRTAATPTATQITAVNKAITRLFIDGASNDEITLRAPDFAIDTAGISTANTASPATLYGQLLAQLSQQAKEKGKALDVVLQDFAAGIKFDGITATLDSAFAKEVLLLAKTQWAASVGSTSHVTVQDLIDGGITGLSGLPSDAIWDARKANLITRIVNTASNGDLVDTLAEVQTLANKVLALAKIQDYATLDSNPAPTETDYASANLTGVTLDNLAAVNLRVLASDAAGTSTEVQLGTLVSAGTAAHTAAVTKIEAYANPSSSTQPTLADYVDAGITHVTDANLIAVNAKVHAATSAAADTTAEIQTLTNEGIVAYADAITTHFIHAAALDTTGPVDSQIVLHFDGLLSGLPSVSDFSNFKVGQGVGAVDAALNSVAITASDIQLILNLSAGAADAVVSFDYTQNLAPDQQINVAASAAGAGGVADSFAFLMDQASHDNTLTGKTGVHNLIFGNGGSDTMIGAELSDTFVFGAGTTGTSMVTNFSFDQFDALDLSKLLTAYTGGSSNTHGSLSGFVKATTVNGGADLQLQIDKEGGGNFTSGLDATLQLTGAGTGLPASASTDLLNYMLKTHSLVL